MGSNRTPSLEIETGRAIEILSAGISTAHILELDARLQAIVRTFREEQETGYPTLEKNLRAWTQSHLRDGDIGATISLAERIRARFSVFVLVGIGGSDLGGRTLHEALDHPFHNQIDRAKRNGAPEIYFAGDTFDPKRLVSLLDLLESRGLLRDTCVNVVSKSGKTGETIAAAMIIRERMERAGITDWTSQFVATTGQNAESVLWEMNRASPFFGMLPVPDGVGGRFSFASPVGLLPFGVTAIDATPRERIGTAMAGYAAAHEDLFRCGEPDHYAQKPIACDLARWWHLAEQYAGKNDLVFCNYADDARMTDWFIQLYSESIQERGAGMNLIGTRGPTGNHSLLNGIIRGPRDKVVLMSRWLDLGEDLSVPVGTGIGGDLKSFEGLAMSSVQDASCRATVEDYLANGVPTAVLTAARRDPYHLFMLMRVLMDAVAIKGRLQLLEIDESGCPSPDTDLTYRQDAVEGYKVRTRENTARMQRKR